MSADKNRAKSAGFGLPELLLGFTVGAVAIAGLLELMTIFWKHSLLLRENLYVQRQGYIATGLLRSALKRAGSGVCVPGSEIPAVYGEDTEQPSLWMAHVSDKERARVVSHNTQTRTLVIDSDRIFKRQLQVLLTDAHCQHAVLARIENREGRHYRYMPISQSWNHALDPPVAPIAPDIGFRVDQVYRWLVHGYHVEGIENNAADSIGSKPALYRSVGLPGKQKELLLSGINTMRCHYGVDLSARADGAPDRYMSAMEVDAINAWSQVRSVRIILSVRGRVQVKHAGSSDYVRRNFWIQHAI
jgi:hypothetical protein